MEDTTMVIPPLEGPVVVGGEEGVRLLIFVAHHRPYPLKRQLRFEIVVELVIVGKEGFEEFQLRPETNFEKALGQLFLEVGLVASS